MTTWQAPFIASPAFVVGGTDNPAAYLRREIDVRDVRSATLHVTALGLVEPWINGAQVGDEQLAPGWTSYDHRPRPGGGLTFAATAKETPYGRACVKWRDEGGLRTIDVVVPDTAHAEVFLPNHPDELVVRVGSGSHRWTYAPTRAGAGEFNLDTPIKHLQQLPQVWQDVMAVFVKNIREMAAAGEGLDLSAFGVSLRAVLELSPGAGSSLEPDLVEVLARHANEPEVVAG